MESGKFKTAGQLCGYAAKSSGKRKEESEKLTNSQFSSFNFQQKLAPTLPSPPGMVSQGREGVVSNMHSSDIFLPSGNRNYTIVNPEKAEYFVNCRENALPYLSEILKNSNNETQITETLYILDKMLDAKVEGIDKMYPVLSRFNDTKSPNIQTFLAGIYRKTQVPDAFGPLIKMLIQNSINPQKSNIDPNEEIGGAILSYINPRFRG